MAETVPSTLAEPQPIAAAETNSPVPANDSKPEVVAAPKKTKKKASNPAKPKVVRPYPSYLEMITDAIINLKERTGSSQYAISKYIQDKQKALPANFNKLLLLQLKKLVAAEKILKVKGSFKVASAKPKITKAAAGGSVKKKVAVRKPKAVTKKAASKTALKPIAKAKAKVAGKPAAKAKAVAKPKAAAKSKIAASKTVAAKPAAAASKPKTPVSGLKRKADAVKPISKKVAPPAKVSKTSSRASPGKKATPVKKAVKKVAPSKALKKATPVKPAKKATPLKAVKKATPAVKAKTPPSRKGPSRNARN